MPSVTKTKQQKITGKNKKAKDEESVTAISGQLQKKIVKQQEKADNKRGIVFIKNLPHGFYEEQLRGYFEQFGKVTRLRLVRSRRTGCSKGFAFIEFDYPEVAQVAAQTMNNYLMFHKLVKADYIPPEKQNFNYFKTSVRKVTNKAGKEIYISGKTRHIVNRMKEHNNWDISYQKRAKSALKKMEKLKEKLGHLGIDFSQVLVAPQKIILDTETSNEAPTSEKTDLTDIKTDVLETQLKAGPLKKNTKKEVVPISNDEDNTSNEEDYMSEEEKLNSKNKKSKLVKKRKLSVADLLGTTIEEDSVDEDFDPSAQKNTVEKVKNFKKNTALTKKNESAKSIKKLPGKTKKQELIEKKPAIAKGKVQKVSKKVSGAAKKTKTAETAANKTKKSLQIEVAKQIAKPLKTLKTKATTSKPSSPKANNKLKKKTKK